MDKSTAVVLVVRSEALAQEVEAVSAAVSRARSKCQRSPTCGVPAKRRARGGPMP